MIKFLRLLKRIFFHCSRLILKIIDSLNPRFFMFFYTRLLAFNGVNINGRPRYISTKVRFDDFNLITLGDRVVISENVTLLTHDYSYTTALISIDKKPVSDIAFIGGVVIGNNVFIGMNATLLPGTIIEDNVIVGAGSVVRGLVKSNSVVIGNPAVNIGLLSDFAKSWELNAASKIMRSD